jgi:hypothetical protein
VLSGNRDPLNVPKIGDDELWLKDIRIFGAITIDIHFKVWLSGGFHGK